MFPIINRTDSSSAPPLSEIETLLPENKIKAHFVISLGQPLTSSSSQAVKQGQKISLLLLPLKRCIEFFLFPFF